MGCSHRYRTSVVPATPGDLVDMRLGALVAEVVEKNQILPQMALEMTPSKSAVRRQVRNHLAVARD